MESGEGHLLRVLSYNIHKGFSAMGRRFVLTGVRDAIRAVNADIVFLQEVLGDHRRHASRIPTWPNASQFEFLADKIWTHFAYGRNAVYTDGHHGNAILSKYPIVEWSNHDISTNHLEQRGMLHAVIDHVPSACRVHALCVHLGLTKKGRTAQLSRITERLRAEAGTHGPLVVAGDFNDWSQRASDRLRRELNVVEVFKASHGHYARTFPAAFPMLQLDRIYCREFQLGEVMVLRGKPWSTLSDHAALYAEVKLP